MFNTFLVLSFTFLITPMIYRIIHKRNLTFLSKTEPITFMNEFCFHTSLFSLIILMILLGFNPWLFSFIPLILICIGCLHLDKLKQYVRNQLIYFLKEND